MREPDERDQGTERRGAEGREVSQPDTRGKTAIFRALKGSPAENLQKVIELMGGIGRLIGPEDIVVIKPNAQWWNQGSPNLSVLMAFIDLVFSRPSGFQGQVVLGENCHRGPSPGHSPHSGWAHPFQWNSDAPGVAHLNGLWGLLKTRYGSRFTACHWIDVSSGGRRIFSPGEAPGYIYCDGTGGLPLIACGNGIMGKDSRSTIMTYPIFATDQGTLVDFRHGVWSKGSYTGQPLRLINFSPLNHHSRYCGITAVVKNYMGIVDLSGGPDPHGNGRLAGDYFNFHSFPFDKWGPGPKAGMLGREIGTFMQNIRRADLNIITAEWAGLSSRTDPPLAHTRMVLASSDPVALDYHAAKYVLFPNSRLAIHNPERRESPAAQYLTRCAEAGGGVLDEGETEIVSYDLEEKRFQERHEWIVRPRRRWGGQIRPILKYLALRALDLRD